MELVVPLIGLGAMYIISNQNNEEKKKEYETMRENFTGNTNQRLFNHGFKTNLNCGKWRCFGKSYCKWTSSVS